MASEDHIRARAQIYRFISRMFSAPADCFETECRSKALLDAFQTLELSALAAEALRMADYLETSPDLLELAVEYTRLFRGPVKAEAYPYESMHTDGEAYGRSALAVVDRYQREGVQVASGFRDLPDHISAEAEFMQYLCAREINALTTGNATAAAGYRLARISFLREHLAVWLPLFTQRILQHAATPFYRSLATLTRSFVDREMASALKEETSGSDKN